MYVQVEKPKENKSRGIANTIAQRKNGQLSFIDNRPENIVQRKIQIQSSSGKQNAMGRPVQYASEPLGILVNHPSGGVSFTFHHIVPENRLKLAWDKIKQQKLQNPQNTSEMMPGFKGVLSKGYSTLIESAKINIIKGLKAADCYTDQFKGDKFPTPEIIETELRKLDDSYASTQMARELLKPSPSGKLLAQVRTVISKNTKAITNADGDYVTEADSSKVDTAVKNNPVLKHMIMWIPGNIHRGPSDRINPDGEGWLADRDDGGDSFERSAKKVVASGHWTALEGLNNAVEGVIGDTKTVGDLDTAITGITQYGMAEYDADKWERDVEKENKWRLK